jgi:hypothetical protein
MEKEYVMQVAQTIKEQLVALTPMTVLMSWGIKEFAATLYRDLPALRIKVNGRLHAGYVIVALNGSDYYEVYLVKGMGYGMPGAKRLVDRFELYSVPGKGTTVRVMKWK